MNLMYRYVTWNMQCVVLISVVQLRDYLISLRRLKL